MILIRNGSIVVGNGLVLEKTDVLIDGRHIIKVEEAIEPAKDMEVIDAAGCFVLPGFIDTMNSWGARGPGWSDNDLEETTDPVMPHLNAVYAFDHDAMNFQEVYRYGVTSFGFSPGTNSVIGGRSVAFKTYGANPYKMLIRDDVNIAASVSKAAKDKVKKPNTKMGIFALLKQGLEDAAKYDGKKTDYKNRALKKVLDREVPLLVNVGSRADIDALNLLLKDFDINCIPTGCYGLSENTGSAFLRSRMLVLGNINSGYAPDSLETDAVYINQLLDDDFIISISSCGDNGTGGKENLLWNGILYYKRGIREESIIQMMTLNPAKILGIDHLVGSIETGKEADIVVWSENPIISFRARAMNILISGEDVSGFERRVTTW